MRNLLLLFAIIALISINQTFSQEVYLGAKAGINFSDITGEDTDELEGRTSFHIGFVSEIAISDKFSVQPEIIYSSQGAKMKESYMEDGLNIKEEADIKLDYINFPVMAKYYIADGFSLEVGPQIGILVNSEADVDITAFTIGFSESESETIDLDDYVKGFDFALNLGLGYKFDNGLNIGARYNLGLTDGNDDPEFFESDEAFRNSVIQFSVGYFF